MTNGRIVGGASAALDHAADALHDLTHDRDPKRQVAALKAIPTHGRSVTFILQKLRASVDNFDDWYLPRRQAMMDDPLVRYFHDLRNEIQKEGLPQPIYAVLYERRGNDDIPIADVAVGEDAFGIWLSGAVREGETTERTIDSSATTLRGYRLPNPPTEHLGRPVNDVHFEHLSLLYLDYLRSRIVVPARERFVLGIKRRKRR